MLTKAIRMHQRADLHFIANLTVGYSCEMRMHLSVRTSTELLNKLVQMNV